MASILMTIQVLVLSYLPHKMIFTSYPFIKCPSPNRGTLPSDLRLVLNFFHTKNCGSTENRGANAWKGGASFQLFSGGHVFTKCNSVSIFPRQGSS